MGHSPVIPTTSNWNNARPLWFRIGTAARICWIIYCIISSPFRLRFVFDPRRIQAFILVRDLHSPLHDLVFAFNNQGIPFANITLVDAGCTSPLCLKELERLHYLGCKLFRVPLKEQIFGPYAPWLSPRLSDQIVDGRYPFIVTDSDLQLPNTMPISWLADMFSVLNQYRFAPKISLPLFTQDITLSHAKKVIKREHGLVNHPMYRMLTLIIMPCSSDWYACATDTTLSLYRPSRHFTTLSIRLSRRFSIRHLPWYDEFVQSAEFKYYVEHKNPLFGEWSSLFSP